MSRRIDRSPEVQLASDIMEQGARRQQPFGAIDFGREYS